MNQLMNYWSPRLARSLLFFVVDSVCLSVCLSQTLLLLFCFSMESSHFLAISSPWQKLQNVVLRFWICWHGNEIWAIFAKISNCFFFFAGWNRATFRPSVHHDPLYKTLFLHFWFRPLNAQNLLPKIAYNSACTRDRPQMFGLTRGFSGMANSMEPKTKKNVVGPTLVAMATKFGLGAEIQSPTGLSNELTNK